MKGQFRQDSYLVVNLVFAVVIIGVMIYSLVYSPDKNDYPVTCFHELMTGEPCVSCGLSHGFSLIVRGRCDEAVAYNAYSVRVFIFFAAQFVMRVLSSLLVILSPEMKKLVIIVDILITASLVLYSFWPFLMFIF